MPSAIGDYLALGVVRGSGGTAVTVSEAQIFEALKYMAALDGIFAAPEGAATLAAYTKLRTTSALGPEDSVVLMNTGSGLEYLELV